MPDKNSVSVENTAPVENAIPTENTIISNIDLSEIISSPKSDVIVPSNLAEMVPSPLDNIAEDDICLAIKEDEEPEIVLKSVLYGLAEEQAALKTLRKQRSKDSGKDYSSISLKRGMLLKSMAETELQRQALSGGMGDIDLRGPKFREIFKMFLNLISDTFDEVKIPPEYREMFFHALSRNLEGWEERAEKVIKAMTPKNIFK